MEVSRLSGDIKYLGTNGVTLNIDERTRLDLSCSQLAGDINQDQIFFWGKIRGKYSRKSFETNSKTKHLLRKFDVVSYEKVGMNSNCNLCMLACV